MDVRKLFFAQDKVFAVLVFIFYGQAFVAVFVFLFAIVFFIVLNNKLLSNTFEYKIYGHSAVRNLTWFLFVLQEAFRPIV